MNLHQHLLHEQLQHATRRHFLKESAFGLGGLFLGSQALAASQQAAPRDTTRPLTPLAPPLAPKVKRIIFLHMAGAPSQMELFDYKPMLAKYDGKLCPQEYLEGQRFAFIQGVPKLLGPQFQFKQHGKSGATISDRLPSLYQHADKLCFIKSMVTDQFNHAPAKLLMHTGNQNLGYPSMGSWVTWGQQPLKYQNNELDSIQVGRMTCSPPHTDSKPASSAVRHE